MIKEETTRLEKIYALYNKEKGIHDRAERYEKEAFMSIASFAMCDPTLEFGKLTPQEQKKIINDSEIAEITVGELTPLMNYFKYNKRAELNLAPEVVNYLVENTDLSKIIPYQHSPKTALIFLIENQDSQNIKLSESQLDYIIDKSNTSFDLTYTHMAVVLVMHMVGKNRFSDFFTIAQYDKILERSNWSPEIEKDMKDSGLATQFEFLKTTIEKYKLETQISQSPINNKKEQYKI